MARWNVWDGRPLLGVCYAGVAVRSDHLKGSGANGQRTTWIGFRIGLRKVSAAARIHDRR